MDLRNILIVLGVVGGIGLILGIGTGIGRGRQGMPRGRSLLMAAFYPFVVFPVSGISVHLLLAASRIHLLPPNDTQALLQALFAFTIAGFIAAVPSTIAAFFAHTLTWNRHHARKLGTPGASSPAAEP